MLRIIACLLDFIPYLDPLIAGVPAMLIAFAKYPTAALATLLTGVDVVLATMFYLQDRRELPVKSPGWP